MRESEKCPVCLECMDDASAVTLMPVCKHPVHTTCALGAAQYDVRCPICRTQCPTIQTRVDDDLQIFRHLEEIASQQDTVIRRYRNKRSRIIRRDSKLGRLRDRINVERRAFMGKERELMRVWSKLQRETWMKDEVLCAIRKERRVHQRRVNDMLRRLNASVHAEIGPPPDVL